LLVPLLTLGGCGGGNDGSGNSDGTAVHEDGRGPVPVVASCEGDIFIQAPVEALDVQALTLLDLTIEVDDQTRFNDLTLADLAAGDDVDMRGFVDVDDVIVASCLEREETARDKVELRGPVDENGIAESSLFILGLRFRLLPIRCLKMAT
jgi:hypothetical protein